MINEKVPHDIEAEQAILGAIIENNRLLDDLMFLRPETFFKDAHKFIFRSILHLYDNQIAIDEITIGDQLKKYNRFDESGGYIYLAELVDCVPSQGNFVYYAKIIDGHYVLRELIKTASDIDKKARDPEQNVSQLLNEAQQRILDISANRTEKTTFHIKEVITDWLPEFEELSNNYDENDPKPAGIPIGLTELDRLTGGLEKGGYYVVAARPSMGKSALATNIIDHVTENNLLPGATIIFTFEMARKAIAKRILVSNSNIEAKKLRVGNLTQHDWDNLIKSVDNISDKPIYINKSANTSSQLTHEARLLDRQVENGVSLVVVDYLQLMNGGKKLQNREQEVSEISRNLKTLATDLDCIVIALSQLNRDLEKRAIKIPNLSDLRESGAIEQDADGIIFIYRGEIYYPNQHDLKGTADLILAKQREGPTGIASVLFDGARTKFKNI